MRIKNWGLLALGLTCAAMAHAQTYDLDITMTGVEAKPISFIGSFTFNGAGNGFCSAPFCAAGVTPEFSNVNITDPEGDGFTAVSGGTQGKKGGHVVLTDFLGGFANPSSSYVFTLGFNFTSLLGGSQSSLGVSNIVFETEPNVTGIFACNRTRGVKCPTATLTLAAAPAPEMDPASAFAGLALLFGGIAVLRGQQRFKV